MGDGEDGCVLMRRAGPVRGRSRSPWRGVEAKAVAKRLAGWGGEQVVAFERGEVEGAVMAWGAARTPATLRRAVEAWWFWKGVMA